MAYDVTPYCSVADYEARYGAVDDADALLEALKESTVEINATLDRFHISYAEPSDDFAYRLMLACRQMTRRAAPDQMQDMPLDVTQMSMGAGGYTRSYTMTAGYGQIRVMRSEWPLLGIGSGNVGFAAAVDSSEQ